MASGRFYADKYLEICEIFSYVTYLLSTWTEYQMWIWVDLRSPNNIQIFYCLKLFLILRPFAWNIIKSTTTETNLGQHWVKYGLLHSVPQQFLSNFSNKTPYMKKSIQFGGNMYFLHLQNFDQVEGTFT